MYVSLEKSIRTCKVDTAWADRLQSDRFLNANNMVCPVWNQQDNAGRPVCWDSFWTKAAGCNNATDRVVVENALRPQYIEYVNLDAEGIRGEGQCAQNQQYSDAKCGQQGRAAAHKYTGQFGYQSNTGLDVFPNCVSCRIQEDTAAAASQQMRNAQVKSNSVKSFLSKFMAGN